MRSRLLIIACLLAGQIHAQSKLTVGQYSYLQANTPFYVSPVVQYQSRHKWYAEARYNYEDLYTCSLYAGYTFSNDHALSYTVTPMIGWMMGKLQGGSVGINAELDYKNFYCATQSQYCVSRQDPREDFFYSWSEAGYKPVSWFYAGLALQHTKPYRADALMEPGLFVCLSFGQWSFPVYSFMPAHGSAYFVAGIVYEWKYPANGRIRSDKPSYLKRANSPAY